MVSVNCFNRKETYLRENSEKNVFKLRLHGGGVEVVLYIFGGNDSIKILWGRACHCVINQNNTITGSYFKFWCYGISLSCKQFNDWFHKRKFHKTQRQWIQGLLTFPHIYIKLSRMKTADIQPFSIYKIEIMWLIPILWY